MTISSTNTKNSYSGDGSTVAFSYTFKILDDDDITVILRTNATGAETVQTKTTHYTVSGVGNAGGGTITFVSAPAATETVVLLRNVPLTQTTDYTPNDPFPAATHEDALDKLTLMAQDTQEEVDRSIKLSRTNTMTSTEFTVGATDRANKVFAFDSSGELAVTQEIGTFQGDWAASTAYAERDLVKDTSTNNIFIVNSAHTSSGSQPLTTNTNSSKYDLIVDAAAATTSATNAATSATAAATSATAAANSASAAATSESNAAGSEASVAADAAAAAASAASASTSETNASTSETNASNSASAAATSATNAATSATSASNSASAAGTSETNAATSATNAANSAAAASTSASNAATSESNASTSETNASTSASSASTSASAAAASAASAAASFDAFDDIYLGAKASAPTQDNDGDALTNGDLYFDTGDNELYIWNGSAWQAASPNIVADTTPQLGGDLDTNGNDINFGDNDKAVFGAGSDLQIYHDAGNSRIVDAGTGNLNLQADNNVNILNNAGTEFKAQFITDGAVNLFYDNSKKFETTATGIDVTGTVTADGLTVDGANTIDLTSDSGTTLKLSRDGSAGQIASIVMQDGGDAQNRINSSGGALELEYGSSNTDAMKIANNGDISFYDNTGTTQGLFWDASTQNLGLGTTSPARALDISSGHLRLSDNYNVEWGGGTNYVRGSNASNYLLFATNANERLRIDSSGNVLVGTATDYAVDSTTATGVKIKSNGMGAFYRDGGTPLYVNRGEDGTLVDFRKDGTTVGSISSSSGKIAITLDPRSAATTGSGFLGGDGAIFPSDKTGVASDADVSLGGASTRFKDLYLSGGAYIGGTAAANKLDDYEEGTFTPSFTSTGASFSYGVQGGNYTKVGRLVMCSFRVSLSAAPTGTTSNVVYLSGLPFSSATLSQTYHGGSIGHYFNFNLSATGVLAYQTVSGTSTTELKVVGDNLGETAVLASHLNSGAEIRGQVIYHAS